MTDIRQQAKSMRSAWNTAREYGCDMSLLEENLRKTPSERIRAHQYALSTLLLLKSAMEKRQLA